MENDEPVAPDSLFRIASVSKPIAAVAVLQLVENGLQDLDDRVFEVLAEFEPPRGATRDPRLDEITVRHLLLHTGGWDRVNSFDPMAFPLWIESELGVPKPVSCPDLIRYPESTEGMKPCRSDKG